MSWKTHCKYAHYILKIIKAKPSQSRAILLHFNIKVCTICFNKKISTIKEIGHKMNCNYLQERKKKKEKEICCSCRVLLFFHVYQMRMYDYLDMMLIHSILHVKFLTFSNCISVDILDLYTCDILGNGLTIPQ